ncbi:glycosyltransferase [Methanobrevibacter sp.]|uniref:glycosyltransferase family protein n=1 Tax=Methanobrevibacter sp. TaxID=66852 RepID=UPI003890512D
MISVIVLVHNMEDYLHVCLNSVLKQTYQDFEIICIDDASKDSSVEILEYFTQKDSRIRIYKNETKKGLKYCKKKALKVAKGEHILFLNADEWIGFNTLKTLSNQKDRVIKTDLINKSSDFITRVPKKVVERDIEDYEEDIQKLQNDKIALQKKLGKYAKAEIINKIINEDYSNLTIAIKSPHPKETKHWGDLFLSIALKKAFEKLGFNVLIQEREHWYDEAEIDIALVLRGLKKYNMDYSNLNLIWNMSHPELVSKEEYGEYDYVFISSRKYAEKIKSEVDTNVAALLQCTDPEVFYYEPDDNINEEILFVGVTRGVYRKVIKDVLKTNHDVSIYGMGWEKYIDEKYVKGQFIPNKELHKYYSSCKILLNDHWEDMRYEDFPSNRLFDALACGTFVISDKIPSADTLFEGSIVTYDGVEDLNEKIDYYLTHEEERLKLAEKGKKIVLENHTFDDRVNEILDALKKLRFGSV